MKRVQDHYFQQAKKENYAARSAYKLQEIQQKYPILRPGQTIADLGCAPGSWLQYASKIVGSEGFILGLDLQAVQIPLPKNVHTLQCAIEAFTPEHLSELHLQGHLPAGQTCFDLILSDMAPRTTGNRNTDNAMSFELCCCCLNFAENYLKPGGSLVFKTFGGAYFDELLQLTRQDFAKVKTFKPKSSRSESKETFIIAQ